jgi:hypothetical protein
MNRGSGTHTACLTPDSALPAPVALCEQLACISTAASFGRTTEIAVLASESLSPAGDGIAAPVHGRSVAS